MHGCLAAEHLYALQLEKWLEPTRGEPGDGDPSGGDGNGDGDGANPPPRTRPPAIDARRVMLVSSEKMRRDSLSTMNAIARFLDLGP